MQKNHESKFVPRLCNQKSLWQSNYVPYAEPYYPNALFILYGILRKSQDRMTSLAIDLPHGLDVYRRALCSPFAVIDVVKAATEALIENIRATQRERAIYAERKARGVDGISLRRVIELKLEVGGNVSSTARLVSKLRAVKSDG